MLSCLQATETCSDEMERPLRFGERISLRTHLLMCRGCSRYRDQLRTLREAMRGYAEGRTPDDDPPEADAAPRGPGGA